MDSAKATELNALLNRLLDEAEGASPPTEGFPDGAPSNGETSTPADGPPPPAVPSVPSPASGGPPSSSGGAPSSSGGPSLLSGLLSNPALLTALPALLENAGPLLGALSAGNGSARPSVTRPHTVDRHTALLCALKPYLSPERQTAADTVIRLCRMWDALERSGISFSGLFGSLSAETGAPHEGR